MRLHHAETFTIGLPDDWRIEADEERLYLISQKPPGVLCCTPEYVSQSDDLPNLSRMLAGFLTRGGHPVATDELLRVTGVVGADGFFWQYLEHETFHRVWIFGNHRSWLFLTFTSASADMDAFHPVLEGLLKTLVLTDDEGDR